MKKILLVDDTPDLLENLTELLRMEDYEVAGVVNGADALHQLTSFKADMIITDLRMPVMDGFMLLEKLKVNSVFSSIPVAVFSANVTPENQTKCFELGAIHVVKKPCSVEHILQFLSTFFSTSKQD